MERESDNPAEYIRNILVTEPANENETGIYRRISSETRFTDRMIPSVLTLRDLWHFAATDHPDNNSYGTPHTDDQGKVTYSWETYKESFNRIVKIAKASKVLFGLKKLDRVGVYGTNCADLARILGVCNVGAWISVSLYDAYGPKSAQFIVQDSEIQVVFCTPANFDAIVGIQKECSNLRFIVVFDKMTTIASSRDAKSELLKEATSKTAFSSETKELLLPRISVDKNEDSGGGKADVYFLSDLEEFGIRFGSSLTGEDKLEWAENVELDVPNEDDLYSIIYTSGTTAQPKGAMIKHGTITIQLAAAYRNYLDMQPTDMHLSYLPLAHVLECTLQALCIYRGTSIAFYRGNPRTLTTDAAVVKPTFFVGTPRVFERVRQAILSKVNDSPFYKKWIFNAAVSS
ncbi:MAG: long-chain acyl-CoA synthetase, partial [Streblomastix strix]